MRDSLSEAQDNFSEVRDNFPEAQDNISEVRDSFPEAQDENPPAGEVLYRLKQVDNDGKTKYYDPVQVTFRAPKEYRLLQNSPNPFNPVTSIKFQIPVSSPVSIKVYDELGRKVITLLDEEKSAGSYIVYWNGKDTNGQNVSSGIYIYRLSAGNYSGIRKMNLLK